MMGPAPLPAGNQENQGERDLVWAMLGVVKHLRLESATNQLADQAPGWGKGVGCAGCGDILRLGAGNGGVGPDTSNFKNSTMPVLHLRGDKSGTTTPAAGRLRY